MTSKELQEKIIRLETELAEIKKTTETMKGEFNGGAFKPDNREEYWFISGTGQAYESEWVNHPIDHSRYSIGNCFPTEQAAIDTTRVQKLTQKAKESQGDFVPNWKDSRQIKRSLVLYQGDIIIESRFSLNIGTILGYWGDKLTCEEFIKDNYDELLWFFTEYNR